MYKIFIFIIIEIPSFLKSITSKKDPEIAYYQSETKRIEELMRRNAKIIKELEKDNQTK